jgi:hypothetical protein
VDVVFYTDEVGEGDAAEVEDGEGGVDGVANGGGAGGQAGGDSMRKDSYLTTRWDRRQSREVQA